MKSGETISGDLTADTSDGKSAVRGGPVSRLISAMPTLGLDELKKVKLLTRYDSKFVIPEWQLGELLVRLQSGYALLTIDGLSLFSYRSRYFDSDALGMYHDHHNGKANRRKVRTRYYLDSGEVFNEIKLKDSRGVTVKTRLKRESAQGDMDEKFSAWVAKSTGLDTSRLAPALDVTVRRLTFVDRDFTERLTIDLDLEWERQGRKLRLGALSIVEVKHERKTSVSPGFRLLRGMGLRPGSLSKYCVGLAKLEPSLKQGRFKPCLLDMDKTLNYKENK
jgi:hypothetical protein